MALSPFTAVTLQSVFLSAVSNILAQLITGYRNDTELWIDWIPVFRFVLFALVLTPPNYVWQKYLETTFPAYPPAPHPKKSDDKAPEPTLSVRNTAIKLVLDQTVGAGVNTLLFSGFTHTLRAATAHAPRITNVRKAVAWWSSPGAVALDKVDFDEVWAASKRDFWPFVTAGWKLWPAVALGNFTLVKTVEMRNLVGGLAGLGWGVYVSMITA